VILTLLLACTGDSEDVLVIPDDLAPLETNTATAPADGAEAFQTVSGEEYEYDWVHGQGYIHASVDQVWLAFQDLEVVVDRAAVAEYSMTSDTNQDYDISFQIDNTVHDLITVEYVREWRESVVGGTAEEPEVIGIRFEKISGTEVIEEMVGSIILTATEDGHTHLDVVEQIIALQRGPEPILQYIEDLYEDALAFAHGDPLPERTAPQ
jgi:hypothetical protein